RTEHCIGHESRAFREQPQLPRRVARGPEIEGPLGTVAVQDNRSFVVDRSLGVEGLPRLQMAHGEIRRECAQGEAAAGPERAGELPHDCMLVVATTEEAEAALAQADHHVELTVERT